MCCAGPWQVDANDIHVTLPAWHVFNGLSHFWPFISISRPWPQSAKPNHRFRLPYFWLLLIEETKRWIRRNWVSFEARSHRYSTLEKHKILLPVGSPAGGNGPTDGASQVRWENRIGFLLESIYGMWIKSENRLKFYDPMKSFFSPLWFWFHILIIPADASRLPSDWNLTLLCLYKVIIGCLTNN